VDVFFGVERAVHYIFLMALTYNELDVVILLGQLMSSSNFTETVSTDFHHSPLI